jgi:hypothetical protein
MSKAMSAELVLEESKRDGRGRRLESRERRAKLVAAYRASGLTMAAFAREAGVKYPTFVSWVKQPTSGDEPIRPLVSPRFAEVSLPFAGGGAELSVTLVSGHVVRGANPRQVAALVRALEA